MPRSCSDPEGSPSTLRREQRPSYGPLLICDKIPEKTDAILDENDFHYDTRFLEFKAFYSDGKSPIYLVGPTEDLEQTRPGLSKGEFKPVEGPHWKKTDLEREVLK